jgi:hypothetical protein
LHYVGAIEPNVTDVLLVLDALNAQIVLRELRHVDTSDSVTSSLVYESLSVAASGYVEYLFPNVTGVAYPTGIALRLDSTVFVRRGDPAHPLFIGLVAGDD